MKMFPEGAMLAEAELTINERRTYLKPMWPRDHQADRAGRSHLLTAMEPGTGVHRNSRIRVLARGALERRKRTAPRPRS